MTFTCTISRDAAGDWQVDWGPLATSTDIIFAATILACAIGQSMGTSPEDVIRRITALLESPGVHIVEKPTF